MAANTRELSIRLISVYQPLQRFLRCLGTRALLYHPDVYLIVVHPRVVIATITMMRGAVKEPIAEVGDVKVLGATAITLGRARDQIAREDRIKVVTSKIIKNPTTTTRRSPRLVWLHR